MNCIFRSSQLCVHVVLHGINNACSPSHTSTVCKLAFAFLHNLSIHSYECVHVCVCMCVWNFCPLTACISTWAPLERGSVFTVLSPRHTHKCTNAHTPDRARGAIWPSPWAAASRGSSPRANEGGSKSALPCLPSSSRSVSIPLSAVHKQ